MLLSLPAMTRSSYCRSLHHTHLALSLPPDNVRCPQRSQPGHVWSRPNSGRSRPISSRSRPLTSRARRPSV
eukprot:280356-Rhodomonas_salina.1